MLRLSLARGRDAHFSFFRSVAVSGLAVVLLVGIASLGALLSAPAAQAQTISGAPSVTAVDPNGAAINVPFYLQGACTYYSAVQSGGIYVVAIAPLAAPVPKYEVADCGNQGVETSLIGSGRECTDEDYPYWTITNPANDEDCYSIAEDPATSTEPATWIVRVPLTVTDSAAGPDNGQPLIFDYWENDGATTDYCRTGDIGEVTSWPTPQGEDGLGSSYPSGFTDGDSFRAWGSNGSIVAHYALASDAASVAPLIEIDAPIDCQSFPLNAQVPATFECDDQGGPGVASCLGNIAGDTGTISDGGDLDTSTPGWHTFTVTAKDVNGDTRTQSVTYFVDGSPPIVSISASPYEPANTGWYTAAQLGQGNSLPVTVTATPGPSGLDTVNCSLNGSQVWSWSSQPVDRTANPVTWTTPAPEQVTVGQGENSISCTAVAISGWTVTQTQSFDVDTLDTGAPTTTITASPALVYGGASTWSTGVQGWYTGPVTVSVAATDPGSSPIYETRCVLDPASVPTSFSELPSTPCPYLGAGALVSSPGLHTFYAASEDEAANIENVEVATFNIAALPPLISTYSYTGGPQSFTVPPGVETVTIDALGAQGGSDGGAGGLGGEGITNLAVTPGQVLQVDVGGAGGPGPGGSGWNGGGASGSSDAGGGGGASDLRTGTCAATLSCAFSTGVVVGGGGGGGSTGHLYNWSGGTGGGSAGGSGAVQAGSGGTQTGGGAGGGAGAFCAPSDVGSAGNAGEGGVGGPDDFANSCNGGGGGGGGYFGGGGGGDAQGEASSGGGGSGYGQMLLSGVQSGNGVVVISYEPTLCSAGTYSTNGYLPCTAAPAGSYVPTTGSTSATLCPPGTYSATSGAVVCTQAPAGSYDSGTGNTSASLCAIGYYSSSPGSSACTPAPAGSYVPTSGSSSATLCPPGTYSATSGAVVCTQAPAGSYDSGTGNTSASLCAVGYYSSSPGSSACTPAPAGSYVPTSGSSSATLCPPGTYSATSGAVVCTQAPAGSYDSGTGNTSASLSAVGYYSSSPGSSACTPAPAGSYVPTSGSSSATLCPPGTYSATSGAVVCTQAPAGSYVPTTGNTAATLCPPGTYSATSGAVVCTQAPAGSYDSGTGNTSASLSAVGYYSSLPGSSACTPAPAGSYVPTSGSSSATLCPPGTYSSTSGAVVCTQAAAGSYDSGTGNTSATPCPTGTSNTGTGNTSCSASTALTYVGPDQVAIGSTFSPTATLASPVASCQNGQPVTFTVSPDPLTGIGSLALPGTATSSTTTPPTASTASLEPAVGTTGWSSGVYTIMASYAGSTTGTSECATTSTVASLAVTSPGQFSFGGGWYTPSTSVGQTSFGFVVAQDPKSTYSGTLNVVTPGKWWYQANVNSFGLITKTQGLLAGTGSLYWWNSTLNKGHGGWQLVKSNVTYAATANAATKTTPASFGLNIAYTPSLGQPALPNSVPIALSLGGIFIA